MIEGTKDLVEMRRPVNVMGSDLGVDLRVQLQ